MSPPGEPRVYQHIVDLLRLYSKGVVVELGCGGRQYESGVVGGEYFGFDVKRGTYGGPGPDALADAQDLSLGDECADVVFLVAALYLMQDPSRVLDECRRVLREGGSLLVFDYNWWVARRCRGIHRFSSRRLGRMLGQHGFLPTVHRDCVPRRGPSVLQFLYSARVFRNAVYLASNWIVVTGVKVA